MPLGTWPDLALALWADILILSVLARRLPPQNWIFLAILIYGWAGLVEGHLTATKNFAWEFSLAWIGILLAARESGRWLLRRWRRTWGYGFWLAGIASILSGAILTGFSFLINATDRLWADLIVRTVASAAILIVATVLIISKRPTAEVLEKNPLVVWLESSSSSPRQR